MKWLILLSLIFVNISHAQRQNVDLQRCALNQKRVFKSLVDFHNETAQKLITKATKINASDDESREVQQTIYKLANQSYIKSLAYGEIVERFQEETYFSKSIPDFVINYKNLFKTKLYYKTISKTFQAWIKRMEINPALKGLHAQLRAEILEMVLASIAGEILNSLSDEEIFLMGVGAEIGIKAGIDITKKLIVNKAIGKITGTTIAEWAGGPVGIMITLAPLYMSGTLPQETKWLDVIGKHPEFLIYPQRLVETGLVKNEEHAIYQHCLTWQRREKGMNLMLEKLIKKHEDHISKMINNVHQKHNDQRMFEIFLRPAIDNTSVKIKVR